ncbi:hypothetical protein FM042_07780 [Aliidiomarina halalkaliphila]|uniref:Uncharacterized protein n=1 Tax=Aliidiomarina halalkaliphila TaxID=2593535 RepID=A0A552X2M8_9GAMM|nr:hypothetical protein [Aliidiomarina halalkaliphila]TRW48873.1 hypothetical protein FM042_07780 [Aliidiomarina halalkaliphila]
MTATMVMGLASILFLFAIIIGVMLAFARFGKGNNPPPVLVWWHGAFAILGFLILLYGAFFVGYPATATTGIVLIALAAIGGLIMHFKYDRRRQLIPVFMVWVHGVVAVVGFVMILYAMLNIADTTRL